MLYRILHEGKDDRLDCQSHTNYRRLSSKEKSERLKEFTFKNCIIDSEAGLFES